MSEFKKRRPKGAVATKPTSSIASDVEDPSAGDDDVSETLEELIALRKLKRAVGGIDLERLNAGEKKRRKKAAGDGESGEVVNADGTVSGTHGGFREKGKDRMRDEEDDPEDKEAATRKLVKSNNFTGQTNAVDVDKHMMAYIEAELQKRKGTSDFDTTAEIQSLDPRDALYKVAEKYRIQKKEVEEGNVTLSTAMLTAIPEVDLGIDTRLKNIEDTEKAKRQFYEARANPVVEEEEFAVDRFYKARRPMESDSDALAKARAEAAGKKEEPKKTVLGAGRREMATDDQVMDRFKKRQGGKK
ncbi:hypothetical protein MNV49_001180 [Pseudohyphozyma bogoriensis]|nr:hypothetical protein MNV49_001180 [Pseudohyphozyma bogoriensis]